MPNKPTTRTASAFLPGRSLVLTLAIGTLILFWRALGNDFIDLDDDAYVVLNPYVNRGLTEAGLRWAFTSLRFFYWQPLTWISHMLDCQLYGLHPWGHHLTNVLVHTANSVLVLYLLYQLTGNRWGSFLGAAIFAWHPLRVESVVWIAERKDLLAAFFWFLSVAAYAQYARTQSKRWYWGTVGAMALGLASKPTVVTLPFALLLLDYWPLRRGTGIGELLKEKAPMFGLSLLSSYLTFVGQLASEAVQSQYTFVQRFSNTIVSYVRYLGKILWPHPLAVQYPYQVDLPFWMVAGSAALLLAVTALVLWQLRQRTYLAVGWFWFVGTLVPASGLVQVGWQAMADRHTYIPMFGLALALAAAVTIPMRALYAVPALLALVTFVQTGYWENSETLFTHTLDVTSGNVYMHAQLGSIDLKRGKLKEAIPHLEEAVKLDPDYLLGRINLGLAYSRSGRLEDAVACFQEALRRHPESAEVHVHLGMALLAANRQDEAMTNYVEALKSQLRPELESAAHTDMGRLLAERGKLAEAETHLRAAVGLEPGNVPAHRNLAQVMVDAGRIPDAIQHLTFAVQITGGNRELKQMLAGLRAQVGQ